LNRPAPKLPKRFPAPCRKWRIRSGSRRRRRSGCRRSGRTPRTVPSGEISTPRSRPISALGQLAPAHAGLVGIGSSFSAGTRLRQGGCRAQQQGGGRAGFAGHQTPPQVVAPLDTVCGRWTADQATNRRGLPSNGTRSHGRRVFSVAGPSPRCSWFRVGPALAGQSTGSIGASACASGPNSGASCASAARERARDRRDIVRKRLRLRTTSLAAPTTRISGFYDHRHEVGATPSDAMRDMRQSMRDAFRNFRN